LLLLLPLPQVLLPPLDPPHHLLLLLLLLLLPWQLQQQHGWLLSQPLLSHPLGTLVG
jgi:hypothetical protein